MKNIYIINQYLKRLIKTKWLYGFLQGTILFCSLVWIVSCGDSASQKSEAFSWDAFILSIISVISLIIIVLLVDAIIKNGKKNNLEKLLLNFFENPNIIPRVADNPAKILDAYKQVTEKFNFFLRDLEAVCKQNEGKDKNLNVSTSIVSITEQLKLVEEQLTNWANAKNKLLESKNPPKTETQASTQQKEADSTKIITTDSYPQTPLFQKILNLFSKPMDDQKDDLRNLLLNLFNKQNIIPFATDNPTEMLKAYEQVTEKVKIFLDSLEDVVRNPAQTEAEDEVKVTALSDSIVPINEQIQSVGKQLTTLAIEYNGLATDKSNLEAKIRELTQKKAEKETELTDLQKILDNSETKIKDLEAQIKALAKKQVDNFTTSNTNPFLCELHLSAGPRKKSYDPDLGEDVAGFRIQNDSVLFWLLDGTSDLNILRTPNEVEFFSSRLLAQLIAYHVKTAFDGHYELTDLHLLWDKAIQAAEIELQNKIQNMTADLPAAFLQKIIRKSYNIGTVGIIGVLNAQGELKAIRIGDSSLHAVKKDGTFAPPTLSQNPREKDDTQFMSLFIDCDVYNHLTPLLKTTKTRRTQAEFKEIQKIVVHSDGIGGMTQRYMQSVLSKMSYNDFMKQASQISQKTRDDKSFLFIGIE